MNGESAAVRDIVPTSTHWVVLASSTVGDRPQTGMLTLAGIEAACTR